MNHGETEAQSFQRKATPCPCSDLGKNRSLPLFLRGKKSSAVRHPNFFLSVMFAILASGTSGCLSLAPQAPMDFSAPDWVVRQGQAVWKPARNAEGVAGELLVAMNPDGRSVVQFTKTLPFLTAQRNATGWQIEIVPRHKFYSGRGKPPVRLIWLHLPEALASHGGTKDFSFTINPDGGWRLERLASGESLEGYLDAPAPKR